MECIVAQTGREVRPSSDVIRRPIIGYIMFALCSSHRMYLLCISTLKCNPYMVCLLRYQYVVPMQCTISGFQHRLHKYCWCASFDPKTKIAFVLSEGISALKNYIIIKISL